MTRSSTPPASTPTAACSRRSLAAEDAVISDELNHASIIDGIRLCKAQRFRYRNNDMADLEARLSEARRRPLQAHRHRRRLLDGRHHRQPAPASATSPTGTARWSWSTTATPSGFLGPRGRGTPDTAACRAASTSSPARSARRSAAPAAATPAAGGTLVALLRQRSRPYLFSNTLAPASPPRRIAALDLLARSTELRDRLEANTRFFREELTRRRPDDQARHPPHRAGDDRRRARWPSACPRACSTSASTPSGFFYPGRAAGRRPHPHPGLGRAHPRRPRVRRRSSSRGSRREFGL